MTQKMDAERFVLQSGKPPINAVQLVDHLLNNRTEAYFSGVPPKEATDIVMEHIRGAENATAVYHSKYGWFVLVIPENVVDAYVAAWWK